jgi:hypothetical protein
MRIGSLTSFLINNGQIEHLGTQDGNGKEKEKRKQWHKERKVSNGSPQLAQRKKKKHSSMFPNKGTPSTS